MFSIYLFFIFVILSNINKFIENPVDQSVVGEVRALCDGTLIDIDESWWACKYGILGDFQPDLEQNVFDYYKEENK